MDAPDCPLHEPATATCQIQLAISEMTLRPLIPLNAFGFFEVTFFPIPDSSPSPLWFRLAALTKSERHMIGDVKQEGEKR